ncbi:MAG: hypothetical protein ABSG44_06615 [Thermodesulfobacteriota bacterium]|jgi:hypothetical protein
MQILLWVIIALVVVGFQMVYRRLNNIQMTLNLIKAELKIPEDMFPIKR